MKVEASAGDFIATTFTDGHPYVIYLEHKGFREGEISFNYKSLEDLAFVVERMKGKLNVQKNG